MRLLLLLTIWYHSYLYKLFLFFFLNLIHSVTLLNAGRHPQHDQDESEYLSLVISLLLNLLVGIIIDVITYKIYCT